MEFTDLPVQEYWSEYDWSEVLGVTAEYAAKNGDAGPVTAERIKAVLWLTADSPEGYGSVDMACIVQLEDGYAMGEAWADTTGWDCRSGVTWKAGPDLESVLAELSEANREAAREAIGEKG